MRYFAVLYSDFKSWCVFTLAAYPNLMQFFQKYFFRFPETCSLKLDSHIESVPNILKSFPTMKPNTKNVFLYYMSTHW